MTDNQKWLKAAAGLDEDIVYLKSALVTATSQAAPALRQGVERLRLAAAVCRSNAAAGMRWPRGAGLFFIDLNSTAVLNKGMRHPCQIAN